MFKLTLAAAAAVSALLVVDAASAQSHSTSRTRSTTTTTQDGNTTRTETRSTTTSGEVSFDADAAFDALLGMAERRSDPEYQAMRRRAEPARPEDAFGEWSVTDGGRDVGECRFDMRQNGFLGVRRIETRDCPSRLGQMSNWRVENGEVVLCGGVGELIDQAFMKLVDAGYPPEVAWFECFYEVKLVTDLMFERGIAGAFARISNTAEYGAYLTGPRVINDASRKAMDEVLGEVRDGAFVRRLMADHDAGAPELLARRKALGRRPIEAVGAHLNAVAARASND